MRVRSNICFLACVLMAFAGVWAGDTTVWLWQEEGLEPVREGIDAALRARGLKVMVRSTAEMVAAGLKVGTPDVLVLPFGEHYPAALSRHLKAYAEQGGAMVLTGGEHSFDKPLYPTASGIRGLDAGLDSLASAGAAAWDLRISGENDKVAASVAGDSTVIDFDLQSYGYAGIKLPELKAPDVVLEFQVRGSATMRRLALDVRERSSWRWKAIVPVTREWVTQRVHLAQLLPYCPSERKETPKWLAPSAADALFLGVTATMNGRGKHRVEVRGIRLLRAAVPSATVAQMPRFAKPELTAAHWFDAKYVGRSNEVVPPRPSGALCMPLSGADRVDTARPLSEKGRWALFDLRQKDGGTMVLAALP